MASTQRGVEKGILAANQTAHAECLRGSGLRYRSLRLSLHAKVRRKASARSGERMPRFFMSALLSTTILPVDVGVSRGRQLRDENGSQSPTFSR